MFSHRYFNPRTPVGCDSMGILPMFCRVKFQSTHPSGVRRDAAHTHTKTVISIHAPQWGATTDYGRSYLALPISIHAPQWGATTTNLLRR